MFRRILDFIAPRSCIVCGKRLSINDDALCPSCILKLPRTNFHLSPLDNPMARLFWGIIPVERVSAYTYYAPGSEMARAVYDLKYHDRPDIGVTLGRLMATELQSTGFFDGIDLIVPVPLAWRRERQRGYNQSRLLAQGVGEVTRLTVSDCAVRRTVFHGSQTELSRWDRQQNVEDVFRLRNADSLRGRHVLLIDDIVTTGATVSACARELLKVDGVRISILAFGYSKS